MRKCMGKNYGETGCDHSPPHDVFDEPQLLEHFRFGRDGIMFIVDTLRADIEPRRKHTNAVFAELKVFATLQFLATGSFMGTSTDVVGVRKAYSIAVHQAGCGR